MPSISLYTGPQWHWEGFVDNKYKPKERKDVSSSLFLFLHISSVRKACIPPVPDDDMIHKIYPHKLAGVLKLWCGTLSSLADAEKSLFVFLAPLQALIKALVKALTNWWIDSKSIINTFKKTTEMLCEWVYQTVALVKYVMDFYKNLTGSCWSGI